MSGSEGPGGRPARGITLAARLQRVRGLLVVEAPREVSSGRTATKLRAELGGVRWLAYVFRLPETAVVVVPPEVCRRAGVGLGDQVELWLDAVRPERPGSVPADVAAALAAGGADAGALSRRELRQSLLLIKEARDPQVRRTRVEAFVLACRRRAAGAPAGGAARPLEDVEPAPALLG